MESLCKAPQLLKFNLTLMSKNTFVLSLVFIVTSCTSIKRFDSYEKSLILSQESNSFRILQVTNKEDSLILRTPSKKVNYKKDKELVNLLVDKMKTTMIQAPGIGLAAPQIGISRSIFIFRRIDKEGRPIEVAINPKIKNIPNETVCFENDGCLSIQGLRGNSNRYAWIEVEYLNEFGKKVRQKFEGYSRESDFTAIVFQHEYDHLNGILYVDKLCN